MREITFIAALLLPLTSVLQLGGASKILFVLPIATKSHRNVVEPLIQALAGRGHKVTVISPGAPYKGSHPNITEVVGLPYEEVFTNFPDPFEQKKDGGMGPAVIIKFMRGDFVKESSAKVAASGKVDYIRKEKWDLVFINAMFNPTFDCFVYKLGAPVIQVSTSTLSPIVSESVGAFLPSSIVPNVFCAFPDEMTFKERLINLVADLFFRAGNIYVQRPSMDHANKELWGQDCPDLTEMESKMTSLVLVNSYVPLTTAKPLPPNIIEVGGMHTRPSKPIPKELGLDEFFNEAKDGFIYFSLGSVVKPEKMPEEIRMRFLNVFSRLKQRVIWKWNPGHMDNLPPNVKISKWLPQQDILGHPNIRLFITHGGLLSTQEAAFHGTPLLGIPMFADQDMNMKTAERAGYSLTLNILEFTEKELEDKLNALLYDAKYINRAKELSRIIQDQKESPLERAVFYSEYVIRQKGAKHLRSAGTKLNYLQYYSYDTMATIVLILVTVLATLIFIVKLCLRKVCGGSKKSQKKLKTK